MVSIVSRGRCHLFPLAYEFQKYHCLQKLYTHWPEYLVELPKDKVMSSSIFFLPYFGFAKKVGFSDFLFSMAQELSFSSIRFKSNLGEKCILDINLAHRFIHKFKKVYLDIPSCDPAFQTKIWQEQQHLTGCKIPRYAFSKKISFEMQKNAILDRAHRIVVPSLGAMGSFDQKYEDKLRHIPFSFGNDKLDQLAFKNFESDKFTIVIVGLVCPSKGCHYVVEALRHLDFHKFRIKLIGQCSNKPYMGYLTQICPGLEIEFCGFLRGEEFKRSMGDSHFAVFPSVSEGLPLSAFDLMTAGKPIIYSDLSNVSELLGESFKYKYNDPIELSELIEKMVKDTEGSFSEMLRFLRNKNDKSSRVGYFGKWRELIHET